MPVRPYRVSQCAVSVSVVHWSACGGGGCVASQVEMERIARQNLESELDRTLSKLSCANTSCESLRQSDAELRQQLQLLSGANEMMRCDNKALHDDVARLNEVAESCRSKSEQVLSERVRSVELRHQQSMDELRAEKDALSATVASNEMQLQQQSDEILRLQQQVRSVSY